MFTYIRQLEHRKNNSLNSPSPKNGLYNGNAHRFLSKHGPLSQQNYTKGAVFSKLKKIQKKIIIINYGTQKKN